MKETVGIYSEGRCSVLIILQQKKDIYVNIFALTDDIVKKFCDFFLHSVKNMANLVTK